MTEVVRLVVAHGLDAGEGLVHRVLVPDGVQPAIRGHLARVSDATRAALRVAAVVGREFSLRLLEAAHGDAATDLATALAQAEQAGLVATLDDGARDRFNHNLIRETITRTWGGRARPAARRGGRGAGGNGRRRRSRLPLRAGPPLRARRGARRSARAVRYARAAGARAPAAYADEEAAGHFSARWRPCPPATTRRRCAPAPSCCW